MSRKSYRFLKSQRIRKSGHFSSFFKSCRRTDNALVRIYYGDAVNEKGCWGFITSKKIGNAVHRNRTRRCLKEVFRLHQHTMPENLDVVVVAKRKIMSFDEAETHVLSLLIKQNIVSSSN